MKIAIVGMIYRSTAYLDFMARGMLATPGWSGHQVQPFIVANDASEAIRTRLRCDAPCGWLDYRDPSPQDYYLNRVYRAWNAGGKADAIADCDVICFVNSDMWPAPGWLERLIGRLSPETIPCSRLVESGKMESGLHGISQDFGQSPEKFQRDEFYRFARAMSQPTVNSGGLFMPCCFCRSDFLLSGGYPEGNIHEGGPGAVETKFCESGDWHFFRRNPVMARKQHVTVFDSLVYHVQTGEMDG